MNILSAQQLKELDGYTLKKQQISSMELMDRAAQKCVEWMIKFINKGTPISVICGPGNNGADGLVIARLLAQSNYKVECVLLHFSSQHTENYLPNLKSLKKRDCPIVNVVEEGDYTKLNFENKMVVDAVFGIGISRPVKGKLEEVIKTVNISKTNSVIAIDLPSGMFCDVLNSKSDSIIEADFTLTFHTPKFSFFFPESGNYAGKVEVLDIGLEKGFAENIKEENYWVSSQDVCPFLPKRKTFTHKGSYGHAHLIAGSKGKMGAAVLMVKGATSVGTGLVTAIVPEVGLDIVQICVPTAMCKLGSGKEKLEKNGEVNEKYTYGIGPGIGVSAATTLFLRNFLKQAKTPIVIDADALNIISEHREMLEDIPQNSILTPHVKELERLTRPVKDSKERLKILRAFAQKNKIYVVLKDARTIIATPEGKCFFSLNGTPGMATGGSGDVLAGILTGLLAQNYSSEEASKLGVILHGISGEIAAEKHTEYAMTAAHIIENIAGGFKKLKKKNIKH